MNLNCNKIFFIHCYNVPQSQTPGKADAHLLALGCMGQSETTHVTSVLNNNFNFPTSSETITQGYWTVHRQCANQSVLLDV